MPTLLKIIGLQAAWWACVAAYLASERQLILPQSMDRKVGWSAFAVGALVSLALWSNAHDSLTAGVYWVAAVMVSWVLLVLAAPHLSSARRTLGWGAGLMLAAAVLG